MATTALREVLAVFEKQTQPGTPLTAPEVAEELDCTRRTAHTKLTQLADQGVLATKKVGARGRVWWWPIDNRPDTGDSVDDREVGIERAGSESPSHRQALRELHDASRQLMRAETHESVADIAVEAAQRILGLPLNGLWFYDPPADVLDPIAWTEPGAEEFGEPPAFPIDDSLVGQVFQDGAFRVYDDVRTEETLYDPTTRVRSELILPLGDHGVLNASSLEVGSFDAIDVSLGRILAANVETALEKADQLQARRKRRQALRRHRDELDRLNQINALIEQTVGALIEAATRPEIERTVCEQLATSTFYDDAWIVERDTTTDRIVPRVDSIADPNVTARFDSGPATTAIADAIDTRSIRTVHTSATTTAVDSDPSATDVSPYLVVPLTYADTVFGALLVRASAGEGDGNEFSDREQAAFETLGRIVGFVINATNNRQLLLGNTAVELEVTLRDSDIWFLSAAKQHEAEVSIEGLIPTADEAMIAYVVVTTDGENEVSLFADLPYDVKTRVLAAPDDSRFLECAVQGSTGLREIIEYGASIQTARATGERATVTVRFPPSVTPRDGMARIEDAFPNAELNAKRVVDLSDRSVMTIRQRIDDRLTDKQLRVLRTAFLAGYYTTPRQTTAQELADSLDIASSTLHQHLQAAQRKVFDTVLAADSITHHN